MFQSFLPLLLLFLVYSFIASLSKAAKKSMSGQKTAVRARPAAPEPETGSAAAPAPRVAPEPVSRELRPSIRVTEHDDSVYQGSLNAVTGEGYDPCHDEQLAPLTRSESAEQVTFVAPGFRLNWTGDEIVRGIVISEILKRKGA